MPIKGSAMRKYLVGFLAMLALFIAPVAQAQLLTQIPWSTGYGGTGFSSYTIGDILYADTATSLAKLVSPATGQIITSGGAGVAPAWSGSPSLTTSLTAPLLIGGTAVGSTLTMKSTTAVGTTDAIIFQVGSNGATEAARFTHTGNMGIGIAAPNASTKLHIDVVESPPSINVPLRVSSTYTLTGDSAGTVYGVFSGPTLNLGGFNATNSSASVHAFQTIATITGTGTATAVDAMAVQVNNSGAGTLTDGHGILINSFGNSGGGVFTSAYGIRVNNSFTAAANNYAFRSDIPAGANRWNLHMNGTAQNYLAGRLGVGIAVPTALVELSDTAATGTVVPAYQVTNAAHTALTASAERFDTNFNSARTVQWATGALTTQRFNVFQAPTIGFVGASTVTDTCTLCVTGAPVSGTNTTLASTHGLLIQAGAVTAATNAFGITANAPTGGTTNYAAQFKGEVLLGSVIFTGLGTPANGTITFCSDCDAPTLVDSTCTHAGGQTGSFAVRVNGAWKCIS